MDGLQLWVPRDHRQHLPCWLLRRRVGDECLGSVLRGLGSVKNLLLRSLSNQLGIALPIRCLEQDSIWRRRGGLSFFKSEHIKID